MKPFPTQHRHSHGHFHKRVPIDWAGSSSPKRKARLVRLSESQNNQCAYCGTTVVFWWEYTDLVSLWNQKSTAVEKVFQKNINDIKNLAVFEYLDYNAPRTIENTFVACQECRRVRTRGSDLQTEGVSPDRFWRIRRDPVRLANMIKYANVRKRKRVKKVIENEFRVGFGEKLNRSMFDGAKTFVALDLEWHERDERKILEIGLTRLTADGRVVPKHIIIKEHLEVVNKTWVPNKKDHFHHGESETIVAADAASVVQDELSKADGVVVHGGGEKDLTALRHIGLDVDRSTVVYDTQKLFSMMLGVRDRYGLGKVSEFLDHELLDPHNAGNDAVATAMSFIGMREIIEAEQNLSYTGRMVSGALHLDTVEITD